MQKLQPSVAVSREGEKKIPRLLLGVGVEMTTEGKGRLQLEPAVRVHSEMTAEINSPPRS